jgi:hypothetical protein
MPWAFLAVLVVISAINAAVVIFGTDMDGSKAFIATAADQRSLMAFAVNAMMGAGLFGAIAAAREYGHGTVIPTFLTEPRRKVAALAQLAAVAVGGGMLSLIGGALTVGAVAAALPTTEYSFMVSASGVTQIVAAATFAGAAGAVLGAGIGSLVRNTGGAVTAVVLVLFILPPLAVQLVSEAASWIPNTLAGVLSGVGNEVGALSAIAAIALWAVVPAGVGLFAVQRRDVV